MTPSFGPPLAHLGPLFCVTSVTNVTRNGGGPKKVVQGVTRIVRLFLGIATKGQGGPFL